MSKSEETLEKVQESKDNEVKEKGKNSVILTPAGIVIQELKCPSLLISHEKKNIIQLGRMCFTGCMIIINVISDMTNIPFTRFSSV